MNEFENYKYKNKLTASSRMRRLIWEIVYSILFRPTPRWAMNRWRVYLLRSFGAKIGENCRIAPSCKIWAPWNLDFQSFVCIGDGVDCYSVSPIIIGSKVTVSQRSVLCTASHEIRTLNRALIHESIRIDNHAWICAEAFIGPGVCVGEGSVIGARSLVMKDVEPWSVMSGNPATLIKKRVIDS